MSITAADIARRVFDYALEKVIARARAEVPHYVTREDLEQAIIELRFADMQLLGIELDKLVDEGREANERLVRADDLLRHSENVEIVEPDDDAPTHKPYGRK